MSPFPIPDLPIPDLPLSPSIHLWSPGFQDFKGGIQVYSSFLLQALNRLCPNAVQGFALHDRGQSSGGKAVQTGTIAYHASGRWPQPLRNVAFSGQLFSAGLLEQPRLVLTSHVNFTVVAAQLKRFTGIPYWAIAHGFESWEIAKPSVRRALQGADRILAVSSYTRDRLLVGGEFQADQVEVLPNTFDAERFQLGPKPEALLRQWGLRPDQPVILTVNRLASGEAFHAYDQVLAALPRIHATLPDAHYLIVGDGGDRPRLEAEIARRGLTAQVSLAGFVPDEQLPDYYRLCDVFAMPSKLEGFGIVFLEAMASGKPVLASCRDGGTHAVLNGQLGAMVNPEAPDAIAQSLIQILQGTYPLPLLYQPEALRQAVIRQFGFEAFCWQLGGLLWPLLQETPPLPSTSQLAMARLLGSRLLGSGSLSSGVIRGEALGSGSLREVG